MRVAILVLPVGLLVCNSQYSMLYSRVWYTIFASMVYYIREYSIQLAILRVQLAILVLRVGILLWRVAYYIAIWNISIASGNTSFASWNTSIASWNTKYCELEY